MKLSRISGWVQKRKVALGIAAPVLVLVVAGLAFYRGAPPALSTAEVRRGDFVDTIEVRGEIKTKSSLQLVAPSFAGDLQIVKLVRTGTMVKKGDVVVAFDASNLASTLKKQQSQFKASEADIEQSRAQAHLTQEQQATDLLQANYDVQRTELDTNKQEIVSEIEGKETRLKLEDAQQKLKELEQKNTSSKISADADVEGKKQKQQKAKSDVQRSEHQITSLTLLAPADGMVTVLPNFGARNWYAGGSTPDFKEGDRAWPGAAIAALPDMSSFRVDVRVDETDRGRLKLNQPATVRIDAIADKEFKATVLEISPLAKIDYSSWPFTKNFDIVVQILENDPRIRPGMSATARIAVEKRPDSLLVPPQAVFEKNGSTIVYVLHRSKFEERPVQVGRRGKTILQIVKGLEPGEKVALKNPETEQAP
jgi:RND family efflux transporter MFP subunit